MQRYSLCISCVLLVAAARSGAASATAAAAAAAADAQAAASPITRRLLLGSSPKSPKQQSPPKIGMDLSAEISKCSLVNFDQTQNWCEWSRHPHPLLPPESSQRPGPASTQTCPASNHRNHTQPSASTQERYCCKSADASGADGDVIYSGCLPSAISACTVSFPALVCCEDNRGAATAVAAAAVRESGSEAQRGWVMPLDGGLHRWVLLCGAKQRRIDAAWWMLRLSSSFHHSLPTPHTPHLPPPPINHPSSNPPACDARVLACNTGTTCLGPQGECCCTAFSGGCWKPDAPAYSWSGQYRCGAKQ